ncbi:glucosaminidase domain-containing protein [Pseudomonas sp. CAU 1711]|uniref:glucosaminidase domain-containing protein n=1 Tax=Pseudomonas sp. CAU 1711 TaxID=3140356 RepID=UPI0032604986
MSASRYSIVESVGSAIQTVTTFDDLEKHHPSSGQEAGRDYETIDGDLEEIRKTSDGRILIKKDFVLLVNGSNANIPVPCPISGYVKTKSAYGTVSIYDTPGGKLIGQVLHLSTNFKVKNGDYVEYGQPIGIQSGTGAAGTVTYAIHVHVELEKDQFIRYISDIATGAIIPGEGLAEGNNDQLYQFPVRKADGNSFQTEELFKVLEQETTGHYLLGNHDFWHGGVHFSEKSVPHCRVDQPVRCIADGEVIAYRLNRRYLQSEFKGLTQSTNLQYSTSFCLVRHTYESPKRAPEKKEKPKVNLAGSHISLSCARYGRDIADVKLGESGNFEALMPAATELQILEIQDSARSGYRFASAKIISGELIGTNRDGHASTRATGETIWFAALDKNGNPVKDKNNNEIFKILNPTPVEQKASAHVKPERNKLTFYSLYMHLLPFEAFPETEGAFKRRVKVKAHGLNVRSSDNLSSEPLGHISTGSILEVITADPVHRKTPEDATVYELAQAKIISGSVRKAGKQTAGTGDTIWLALSMTEENKPTKSFVDEIPKHALTRPRYWKGKVIARTKARIAAFQNPNDEESKRIGLVAENSTLEYHTDSLKKVVRAGQEKTMAKCSIASGGLWDRQLCPAFVWICIDDTTLELSTAQPTEFDKVVSVSTPIKAGDPISYLGLYETPASINGGKNSNHQVHFEIFTDDRNLDKFLRNEADIKDGKQYLLLPQGTEVHNKNILTSNQLLPASTASRLEREHAVELNKCPIQKDEKGQEWYSVTVYDNAQTISGLVKKPNSSTPSSPEVITQHDWKKLGFRVVQENNPDADGFLDPEDMPEFFQELYREIDKLGDKNGKVTPIELQSALRDPALRERWSKLIAYHPTEWQAKSNEPKWHVLEDLLKENYETIKKQSGNSNIQLINNLLNSTRELFRHEKERIDNLVFWNELEGAMQVTLPKQVYHFHPITFITNLRPTTNKVATKIGKNLSKKDFVSLVHESALREEERSGVPAAITTAQAILETGYGRHVPTDVNTKKYSYNLFGIKAHGNPDFVEIWTHEEVNGKRIKILDKFMAYQSFDDSIKGRTDFFVQNKRYHDLLSSKDSNFWADELQKRGYATDSQYAKKLKGIIKSWDL